MRIKILEAMEVADDVVTFIAGVCILLLNMFAVSDRVGGTQIDEMSG